MKFGGGGRALRASRRAAPGFQAGACAERHGFGRRGGEADDAFCAWARVGIKKASEQSGLCSDVEHRNTIDAGRTRIPVCKLILL